VDYLNERELVSYAYLPRTLPVETDAGRRPAYTFIADPRHRQYAGPLPVEQAAGIILDAEGRAGLNRDYLINTVKQLECHGFRDKRLHLLLERVARLTGEIEAGGGI